MTTVISAVRVTAEKIDQPIVNIVWHVQMGQLLQEGGMPHRVKCLTEVEKDDDNIRVREKHIRDGTEERDDSSGG